PLPGFYDSAGNPLIIADILSSDTSGTYQAYQTLSLNSAGALFCQKGVEDFALGAQRADAENAALTALADNGLGPITGFDQRVGDYVQLTDNILDPSDPYWTVDNACW